MAVIILYPVRHNRAGVFNGEYFHNYQHLGMDLLYDANHTVCKVILKTNAIGYVVEKQMPLHIRSLIMCVSCLRSHPDFGSYLKCNFRLCFQASVALQVR